MRKYLTVFLLLVSAIIVLSACGSTNVTSNEDSSNGSDNFESESEGTTYTFKLGHETPESHIKHLTAEKFKEELNERSDGRMTVDIFPAAQLGGEQEMVQQIETGSLDFAMISNGYMSSRSETLNGWFMPFLFNDLNDAGEARKTDAAKEMLSELEEQGIIAYDVFFAGNRHVLLKSGEVNNLSDVKGQKLRIPGSKVFEDFWKEAGAGPTPMPLPEVYASLQTGIIDGIDIDMDALLSQKYFEIADYLTLTNHITFPEVAIGSKKAIEELSLEDQEIVKDSMEAAVEWGVQKGIELEESRIEEAKNEGMTVTLFDNKEEFESIIKKIHDKYSENNSVIRSFIEQNQ